MTFNPEPLREQFPMFGVQPHPGKKLVYLDSGANALCPTPVLDAMTAFETTMRSNVHRGVHSLSQQATGAYEEARERVRAFIHAASVDEIVFTSGTTEAINLVANSYGRKNLRDGDEILLTELEHHANIVPWQLLAEATGAKLVVSPIQADGTISLDDFRSRITSRTKICAFAHISNTLGAVLPIREMIRAAHEVGAVALVDGAQGIVHALVDVQELDADFYVFSAHKLYGPTGVGVLYGKAALLRAMPPWKGGGDMIDSVRFGGSTWADIPYKFEAGTPAIAAAIGLGAAIDWLAQIDRDAALQYEHELINATMTGLQALGARVFGPREDHSAVVSFIVDGVHPTDLASLLDAEGIAVRTGHHCAQPVMDHYGVTGTVRASFGIYNTMADVEALLAATKKSLSFFGVGK